MPQFLRRTDHILQLCEAISDRFRGTTFTVDSNRRDCKDTAHRQYRHKSGAIEFDKVTPEFSIHRKVDFDGAFTTSLRNYGFPTALPAIRANLERARGV